jgi:hypothetical protein
MARRALFGFDDTHKPRFRIVKPGVNLETATLAQIVYDADYIAARLLFYGQLNYTGSNTRAFQTVLSWPDLGYIPYCLIGSFSKVGYRYYASDPPYGPYGPSWPNGAIMQQTYMATWADINCVDAFALSTGLQMRCTYSFSGLLAYAVFAIPTGA